MSVGLGYCAPNSDSLMQSGVATATWTPDGSGGGTLELNVPKGPQCVVPPPGGSPPQSYSMTLSLGRHRCGQRVRITVEGKGSKLFNTPSVGVGIGGVVSLLMYGPGGSTACSSDDLVIDSGSNPLVGTVSCANGGIIVNIFGVTSSTDELTITVVVELI